MKSSYLIAKAKKLWLANHAEYLQWDRLNENGCIRHNILNVIRYRLHLDSNLLLFATSCRNHWAPLLGDPKVQCASKPPMKTLISTDIAIRWDELPLSGAKHCHGTLMSISALHWNNDFHSSPFTMLPLLFDTAGDCGDAMDKCWDILEPQLETLVDKQLSVRITSPHFCFFA
eukprot:395317_1